MRSFAEFCLLPLLGLVAFFAFSATSTAQPPLVAVEARIGTGVTMGGGSGQSIWRMSPITASALAEVAIMEHPWVSATGGIFVEGYGRLAVGLLAGWRIRPFGGRFRLGAGGSLIVTPYTAYGGSVSLGACALVCTDVQATVFVAGSDIPEDRVATEVQLLFGMAFDAL